MTKLLCLAMAAFAPAAAQTVEGTVIDAVSGAGIAGVRIQISGASPLSATTDAQGHFRIEDVPLGPHEWAYNAPDYYVPLGGSHSFRVTGANPVELTGRLARIPNLAGRILDGHGDPVKGAEIELESQFILQSEGRTGVDGTFHIHHGMPSGGSGGYWLAVEPPEHARPPDPDPRTGGERAWVRTYYPGVADRDSAARIDVRAGAELANLEWKLQAAPLHSVRGMLFKANGTPAPNMEIRVPGQLGAAVRSQADGRFELRLTDDEWPLAADLESGGVKLRAREWIRVAGRDVEGVQLRLQPPFPVRVAMRFDAPDGAPRPTKLPRPALVPRSRRTFGEIDDEAAGSPTGDGQFRMDVYPGHYRLALGASPPGYYLDSARLGDLVLTPAEVELSGESLITVVYKANGATLRGTAEGCLTGQVVAIPVDPALRLPSSYGKGWCDANDRFQIPSLRPGEYYALAVAGAADIPPGGIPNYDDDTLRQSVRVTLRAGEVTEADLHAIVPVR